MSNSNEICKRDLQINEIKSKLLKNMDRTLNHLEFGLQLHKETIAHDIFDLVTMAQIAKNSTSTLSNQQSNCNLTYIYKEALNLFSDISLNPLIRYDFSRFTIPKMICFFNNESFLNQQMSTMSTLSSMRVNDRSIALPNLLTNEMVINAMSVSIYSLSSQTDSQLEHNFNLESQLCEGFLRAKSSKNIQDLYLYMISLGRYALSLKKCDEHMFVCVKHLLEIFDSNENDNWSSFTSALAQRQLFILSKRINMQELLGEFEEKGNLFFIFEFFLILNIYCEFMKIIVCEIISDTIFNSIQRHQIKYIQFKQQQTLNNNAVTSSTSYLQNANYSLKDVLRVFNVIDSCGFIRNYQRYLVPYLAYKATIKDLNQKIITKSLEFLARKINSNISRLIEENFQYVFTYTTLLNSNEIANVFHYISNEIHLDIDKLINCNKQRLFNELLSRCGNLKYRQKVWQAVCVLTAANSEEATALVTMQLDDSRIVKSIEPGLLAALIHFDMCLMRSSINLKEKCQVLESLNELIGLLGPLVITKVRYKIMTTLKLAMKQCSKFSELNCKLWDTFLRNVDKSALGAILNQVSVNLLHLLELQPYKISKIFEYLIIQNKNHLESYFNELYFLPEQTCLNQVNQTLRKYTDVKYILDKSINTSESTSAAGIRALVNLIKHYLKGALHENGDLRVKALEKLYTLLREKCSEIIYIIQRQENSQIISEIVLALLNGCRDSDARAKLL